MTSHKKILLVTILIFESLIGAWFLFKYYQKTHSKNRFVGQIQKENIITPEGSQFKFYRELKPNTKEEEFPEWAKEKATYTYNADGLNERFDYPLLREEGTIRIIALGDSFTFGHYSNTNENWTEILEDSLNDPTRNTFCPEKKFEIINLGMKGFDVPYIVQRYIRVGEKYNPDLVVWFESGSGFYRYNELIQPLIDECLQNKSSQGEKNTFFDCWATAENTIFEQYGWDKIEEMINGHLDTFFQHIPQEKVIFFSFEPSYFKKNQISSLQKRIEKYPKAEFRAVVPNINNNQGVFPDGHPNTRGHEIIRNTLFTSLQKDLKKLCTTQ